MLIEQSRMLNAIEHISLDSGVVIHIFECKSVAGLQGMFKTPVAHHIAAQTGIATNAIGGFRCIYLGLRLCDGRLVRHFETVGHMASKRDIYNGGIDA